jgi:hypothetical protein
MNEGRKSTAQGAVAVLDACVVCVLSAVVCVVVWFWHMLLAGCGRCAIATCFVLRTLSAPVVPSSGHIKG